MASTRPPDDELLRLLADHRPGDVAAKLGVPQGTVRQWKKRLEQAGHQLPAWPPGPPKRTTEATP